MALSSLRIAYTTERSKKKLKYSSLVVFKALNSRKMRWSTAKLRRCRVFAQQNMP
jgi:hypothetical protein